MGSRLRTQAKEAQAAKLWFYCALQANSSPFRGRTWEYGRSGDPPFLPNPINPYLCQGLAPPAVLPPSLLDPATQCTEGLKTFPKNKIKHLFEKCGMFLILGRGENKREDN